MECAAVVQACSPHRIVSLHMRVNRHAIFACKQRYRKLAYCGKCTCMDWEFAHCVSYTRVVQTVFADSSQCQAMHCRNIEMFAVLLHLQDLHGYCKARGYTAGPDSVVNVSTAGPAIVVSVWGQPQPMTLEQIGALNQQQFAHLYSVCPPSHHTGHCHITICESIPVDMFWGLPSHHHLASAAHISVTVSFKMPAAIAQRAGVLCSPCWPA